MVGIRAASVLAGLSLTLALLLAGGSGARSQAEVRWRPVHTIPGILDVVGPRTDGRLIVASSQAGLFLLRRGSPPTPFARGPEGYVPGAGESYIALARSRLLVPPKRRLRLRPGGRSRHHQDRSARTGSALRRSPVGRLPLRDRIRHRWPVRVPPPRHRRVRREHDAVRARLSRSLERHSPGRAAGQGEIAVAPRTLGRFAGQLIAPDEHSGRFFAFDRRGRTRVISQYRFPAGGDIGVESVGFVPPGFDRRGAAYLADLGAPGAPTPGTSSLLTLRGLELVRAGVQPGDLLVATEGGAITFAIRCRQRCTVARSGAARLPRTGRVVSPWSRRRALQGRRLNGSGQRRKAPASFGSRWMV